MPVRLRAQYLCIKQVRPVADHGYGSSPVCYLRSDKLGTHLSRQRTEHLLVQPHDVQALGQVPDLVGVAKLEG